jgi:16S rRNA processing protein RimM
MLVTVGRVGRPHGVRGELTIEVRTDEPERRFAVGAVLVTDSEECPRVIVEGTRWHQSTLLLTLAGIGDRNQAESLRNVILQVDVDALEKPEDEDEYYDHQLKGMQVVTEDGTLIGTVTDVAHLPAQDVLVIAGDHDRELFVPFVREIVPVVDVESRSITITPPPGLFDLDAVDSDEIESAPDGSDV